MKLASYLPKTDNPCGELTYGRKTVSDEAQIVSKVDYQQSDKHSLFGRIVWLRTTNPSPYEFTDKNILTASDGGTTYNFAPTIGSTYLISPQMVNCLSRRALPGITDSTASPPYFEAADSRYQGLQLICRRSCRSKSPTDSPCRATLRTTASRSTSFRMMSA